MLKDALKYIGMLRDASRWSTPLWDAWRFLEILGDSLNHLGILGDAWRHPETPIKILRDIQGFSATPGFSEARIVPIFTIFVCAHLQTINRDSPRISSDSFQILPSLFLPPLPLPLLFLLCVGLASCSSRDAILMARCQSIHSKHLRDVCVNAAIFQTKIESNQIGTSSSSSSSSTPPPTHPSNQTPNRQANPRGLHFGAEPMGDRFGR